MPPLSAKQPAPLVRAASPRDADAMLAICYQTADAGQPLATPLACPELPGLLYATPYLYAPTGLGLVVQDEVGIVGYAVGCADSGAFYAWFNDDWLPRQRRALSNCHDDPAMARWLAMLARHWRAPDSLAAYPAHCHINLLPRAQGRGAGRALMDALLTTLQHAGAEGVHLGVDPVNQAALAFYRKLGFVPHHEEPGCCWLVKHPSTLACSAPIPIV